MGWGCYKHEADAGSESWQKKVTEMSNARLSVPTHDWGRDGEVCPWCWEELEAKLAALLERLRAAEAVCEGLDAIADGHSADAFVKAHDAWKQTKAKTLKP